MRVRQLPGRSAHNTSPFGALGNAPVDERQLLGDGPARTVDRLAVAHGEAGVPVRAALVVRPRADLLGDQRPGDVAVERAFAAVCGQAVHRCAERVVFSLRPVTWRRAQLTISSCTPGA